MKIIFLKKKKKIRLIQSTPEEKERDDEKDIQLVNLIAENILSVSKKVPLMHERLIEILCEGTTLFPLNRQTLAAQCYRLLFNLCHEAAKAEGLF